MKLHNAYNSTKFESQCNVVVLLLLLLLLIIIIIIIIIILTVMFKGLLLTNSKYVNISQKITAVCKVYEMTSNCGFKNLNMDILVKDLQKLDEI